MNNDDEDFENSKTFRRTVAVTIALAGMAQPIATIVIQIARMVREIMIIWTQTG